MCVCVCVCVCGCVCVRERERERERGFRFVFVGSTWNEELCFLFILNIVFYFQLVGIKSTNLRVTLRRTRRPYRSS